MALGGEDRGDPASAAVGVVDDLEDAVTADEVEGLPVEGVGVALPSGDAVGDPEVGGATFEGGEGVGTGVDDGDLVAELRERDGQATRPAAEVEDPQGPAEVALTLAGPGRRRRPRHPGCGRTQRWRASGRPSSRDGRVARRPRRRSSPASSRRAAALVMVTLMPRASGAGVPELRARHAESADVVRGVPASRWAQSPPGGATDQARGWFRERCRGPRRGTVCDVARARAPRVSSPAGLTSA